ncbi:MAG TPA: elongation factor P [Candidatus Sabulitectum sp.]|nr:elongation factor P [Candidatus Sabulitectum sp.]HPF31659.1 elongation factor P [Candidatus Sabulitectum sp.]HPJ28514.1 elongation factor P [Candidatus Sabulitectum sp.]HPR22250.1 elongation factor P [Candidatus Sabulitectum sp.]
MATSNDFRRGMVLDIDGKYYSILEFQHVNPGKGAAFVRSKLKDVLQGKVLEKTWRAGEKVTEIRLERRVYQLLYHTDDMYTVMDPNTYEQIDLPAHLVGDAADFLTDNTELDVLFVGSKPIMVEAPSFVELLITKSDPGLKGDTATGGTKPATLETGVVVQVPLFVEEGERIRVDTRTREYMERAKG